MLIFFAIFIFIPAVYILKYFTNWQIFTNTVILKAVFYSFLIGLIVVFINLIFGVPLAWVIARSRNRIVHWIDNLIDLSLVMPTAALGFSIYLYWGTNFGIGRVLGLENGFFSKGPMMIILLHIVFTLPYMIRSVTAAVMQLDTTREEAAYSLGASPFTFFRTVAMPLFRDGVINGSILSFTRSLSETGATMMVAGVFATAPVLIINLKNSGDLSGAAGASIILILIALFILLTAKTFLSRSKIQLSWANPRLESKISNLVKFKNVLIFIFLGLIIFLPTIYIIFYNFVRFEMPDPVFFTKSLLFSLSLAALVTIGNLLFAVPFSYLIARNRYRIGKLADSLSEVVLLIPTSALGLSLALFWKNFLSSETVILLLAHLSFTFPLLVKPITAAFSEISESQEEAAYSLGARPWKMFSTILMPQIKPALIAGSIMAFMRSLSETGATMAVTKNIKTVSILIVDFFNTGHLGEAAFACTVLFVITLIFLYLLKKNNSAKPIALEK